MGHMPYHLIIPAAGESTRYRAAGYMSPKGLIRFKWKDHDDCMIHHIIRDNVPEGQCATVIARQIDFNMFQKRLNSTARVLPIVSSEGQAHTVFQGIEYMADAPLLVVNCDNAFDSPLSEFVDWCQKESAAVGAMVFKSNKEDRYGYVDNHPFFSIGAEKQPISEWALAGAFYFENVGLFRAAFRAVHRTSAYISELFQVINGKKIAYDIPRESLHEWGTPADLKADKSVTLI